MLRTAMMTGVAVVVAAGSALAMGPRMETYQVEGYLDQAPADAQVIERLALGHGETERVLHVTATAGSSTVEVCPSCDPFFDTAGTFAVTGDSDDVERLLSAPRGGKVSGLFTRPRADLQVVVDHVETSGGSEAVADATLLDNQG